jgi:hypothetical protein
LGAGANRRIKRIASLIDFIRIRHYLNVRESLTCLRRAVSEKRRLPLSYFLDLFRQRLSECLTHYAYARVGDEKRLLAYAIDFRGHVVSGGRGNDRQPQSQQQSHSQQGDDESRASLISISTEFLFHNST